MDTLNSGIKPIEIFKAGSFTAMNRQRYTFTAQQVRELADTYNPDFADAPLVVGHPKLTSPRFGRAGRLFVNDAGVLCADADQVVPEFAEAVNSKLYPKVSASIYLPDAPGNPTPGKHYLRHIGFLGGAAPAVKGLKSVEFSADAAGVVSFGYEDRVIVGMFRRIRDWIIAKDGADTAQSILPDYQLDSLAEDAIRDDLASPNPDFANPTLPENDVDKKELEAREAALQRQQQEIDARAAAIAAQETKMKQAGYAEFAESLCQSGQLLPVQKDSVVQILVHLDAVNQVADFAEGHANHGKTGADLFKDFLAAQPKQVVYGRVSPQSGAADDVADFAAPPGYEVDPEGLDIYRKAVAYQKQHPDTDLITAAKIVAAG
jgi:hypothetical protein